MLTSAASLRITGVGGWIGSRLLQEAKLRRIDAAGIDRAELLDERSPLRIASGSTIVHLAAIAHRPMGSVDAALFDQINRDLAVSCAQRCLQAGARRFVFVSTAAVMPSGRTQPWTEADMPDPRDAYSRAKLAAEQQLGMLHELGRFEVVVVRPPLVYGPGARANFAKLLELAKSGRPLPLAGATALRSMVFLDNLVDALLHVARAPQAAGRTFFVTDDTDCSVADWIRAVRAALGMPPRLFAVPTALVRVAARCIGRWSMYERLFLPMRVDGSALRATGWAAPFDRDAALRRTLQAHTMPGR